MTWEQLAVKRVSRYLNKRRNQQKEKTALVPSHAVIPSISHTRRSRNPVG